MNKHKLWLVGIVDLETNYKLSADYYKLYHGSLQARKNINSLFLIITFVNLSSGAILLYRFLLKY